MKKHVSIPLPVIQETLCILRDISNNPEKFNALTDPEESEHATEAFGKLSGLALSNLGVDAVVTSQEVSDSLSDNPEVQHELKNFSIAYLSLRDHEDPRYAFVEPKKWAELESMLKHPVDPITSTGSMNIAPYALIAASYESIDHLIEKTREEMENVKDDPVKFQKVSSFSMRIMQTMATTRAAGFTNLFDVMRQGKSRLLWAGLPEDVVDFIPNLFGFAMKKAHEAHHRELMEYVDKQKGNSSFDPKSLLLNAFKNAEKSRKELADMVNTVPLPELAVEDQFSDNLTAPFWLKRFGPELVSDLSDLGIETCTNFFQFFRDEDELLENHATFRKHAATLTKAFAKIFLNCDSPEALAELEDVKTEAERKKLSLKLRPIAFDSPLLDGWFSEEVIKQAKLLDIVGNIWWQVGLQTNLETEDKLVELVAKFQQGLSEGENQKLQDTLGFLLAPVLEQNKEGTEKYLESLIAQHPELEKLKSVNVLRD